jgi:hypothetical protein
MAQIDFPPTPHAPLTQDTTWTEPAAHHLRVEVVTDDRRLVGLAHHATLVRLVDMLRLADDVALPLTDVEITPLDGSASAGQHWRQAHIHRRAIVFAIPNEVAPPPAAATKPYEYVEKRRWRVSALLPGFVVTGYFHLPPATEPTNASLFWNAGFLPLTDAEAVYLPDPTITWKADVIVVNTSKVEAYCPEAALASE